MPSTPSDSLFEKYVPSIAAEWDLEGPAARWREVEGSLCFIDISGFTNLAERLSAFGRIGAEELADVLNRVFSSMIHLAYERGAIQLKFGGDALLLFFTGQDHARQACAAAVEMRAALREASQWSTSVGRLNLKMSVGIHSGLVHLFRVGASHLELLVSGPAATVTTAMEATAAAGEIVASSDTRALLPPGSAEAASGTGWLLRWRQAPVAPSGFIPRRPTGHDALLSNIPLALREYLLRGPTEPEHRVATVAFVKFGGVDDLLARHGAAYVADALDRLIGEVQAAADAEEVTFLATDLDANGGKIILTTGVPIASEDDAGRMLRALRRLAEADLPVPVRMGVNRGHVFAGDIGNSERRTTYTVMGDTVNLAARLMSAAPPGSIYSMPGVLDASRTLFDTSALEPFHVRGKSAALQAYEVGEELGSRPDDMRLELPFVGRATEVAGLVELLASTVAGAGGVVTVRGVAGIGKSRLVHEALSRFDEFTVMTITGEPFRSATPYRPFRDAVRRGLGLVRGDAADMARQLEQRAAELDPALLPLLPLLGSLTHVEVAPTAEVSTIEPRFLPDRVAAVALHLLELLVPGPFVLVAEDAHWMDEPTTYLLERLAAAAPARPWLVISARRPDAGGFDPDVGRAVELGPLTGELAEELVVAATAAAPLRPHDVGRIVERGSGNPLYLEETIRAVRELGSVDALPESLHAMVNAQIDALPPAARRLLRCASVLGGSFREPVLRELLDDTGAIDDGTWRQLDRFLERTTDRRLRFRHAVQRDTAYEGLPYRRRRQLHHRAGEVIEREADGSVEAVADLLAVHYSRALDHDRAWHFGRMAGDRAKGAFANIEAAANYELALDAGRRLPTASAADRAEVWSALGDVREEAGLFTEALEAYRRASVLQRGDVLATAELQLKRARSRERAGSYTQALRETTLGFKLAQRSEQPGADALAARLLAFNAVIRQAQEHPRLALTVARQAVEEAQRADEPRALARAYGVLDWAYLVTGQPERAVHGEAALRIYVELDDLPGQARTMNGLGAQAYFDGRWADAVDLYQRAREAFLRAGNAVQAAIAGANVGELLVNQDRLAEAEPVLRDAVRVQRASGFVDGATFAEVQLARLLMARGELDEAERLLTSAHDELVGLRLYGSALEAAVHLAHCRSRLGDPLAALELLAVAEDRAGEEGDLYAAAVARVRALALLEAGRGGEALEIVTAGIATARDQGLDYELTVLLVARAQILGALGLELDTTDLHQIEDLTRSLDLGARVGPNGADPAGDQRMNLGSPAP